VASDEVEVVFVDGDTGAQVGRARLSRDRVPESFDTHTTVALGTTTWLVEHADTSSAADVAAGRRLVLTVRRVDAVPPADILYSLPTICDVLPASAGGAGIDRLQFHEDDWRQVEMVSRNLLDVVAGELQAIRGVYEGHARRDASGSLIGFEKIHVRTRPDSPLPGPPARRQLQGMFPAADYHYGGVGFTGSPGIVAGSFAAGYGPVTLYGVADGDHIEVLGLRRLVPGVSPSPAVVTALRQAMDAFNVVIVDWCRCSIIDASSVADYLAPLRLCLSDCCPASESTWVSPRRADATDRRLCAGRLLHLAGTDLHADQPVTARSPSSSPVRA
jgi:hypothetical protein